MVNFLPYDFVVDGKGKDLEGGVSKSDNVDYDFSRDLTENTIKYRGNINVSPEGMAHTKYKQEYILDLAPVVVTPMWKEYKGVQQFPTIIGTVLKSNNSGYILKVLYLNGKICSPTTKFYVLVRRVKGFYVGTIGGMSKIMIENLEAQIGHAVIKYDNSELLLDNKDSIQFVKQLFGQSFDVIAKGASIKTFTEGDKLLIPPKKEIT